MAHFDIITPTDSIGQLPTVRKIGPADLKDALAKGLDDFWAMPTHVVFLSLIYPIVGLLLAAATFGFEFIPLLYPLAAGFALIGPFAAIGLYELSRRRALGMDTSWKHAFDIIHSPSIYSILALGLLLLAIFCVWLAIADAIYVANFGWRQPASLAEFGQMVVSTSEGRNLIIVGNAVGAVFAILAFSLSVISFPLLVDRNVGFAAAVLTSLKVVIANPMTMALWGLIVAGGLVIGSLPLFVGLAVVMPILGHATWHLYTKAVEPDSSPRPNFQPRPKGKRYAADFPACLFSSTKVDEP
jgi:uncharacterized membrane protein